MDSICSKQRNQSAQDLYGHDFGVCDVFFFQACTRPANHNVFQSDQPTSPPGHMYPIPPCEQIAVKGTPPSPRSSHSAVVIGNSLVVYGGSNGNDGVTFNDLFELETGELIVFAMPDVYLGPASPIQLMVEWYGYNMDGTGG